MTSRNPMKHSQASEGMPTLFFHMVGPAALKRLEHKKHSSLSRHGILDMGGLCFPDRSRLWQRHGEVFLLNAFLSEMA